MARKKRAANTENKKTIHGSKVKVYIFEDLVNTKTPLAFTQGLSLDRSADTIETTTRDSDEWKEFMLTFKEFSFSVDGLYSADEESHDRLEDAFENNETLMFGIELPNGKTYVGQVLITSFPLDAGYSDAVTYSTDFQGTGKLHVIRPGNGEPEDLEALLNGGAE